MDNTTCNNLLERAIGIAVEAHQGQKDKAGQPYILHPLRVMLACSPGPAQIVGVLHDVVEDCRDWSFERLRAEGLGEDVLTPLRHVTKLADDEDYAAFIERVSRDPVARGVKIVDLRDNLDLTRIAAPTEKDFARLGKYVAALRQLQP